MAETRKIAAILAADVVGFSRMASVDEDRTLANLRALRSDLIDPIVKSENGRIFKRTGDGALIEFRSVVEAVRCAVTVQKAMVERNAGIPVDQRIVFRIGIHLGDVVEESDGDLMGDGVNIAARLEGVAKPGAICLSEAAYFQVKSRLDLKVIDLGRVALKNIAEPVRVYSVEVGESAASHGSARVGQGSRVPILATLAVVVAAAVVGAWYLVGAKLRTTAAASFSTFGPAVAVLSFTNTSGEKKDDPLATRIGLKTIDYLGKYSNLRTFGSLGDAAKGVADPIGIGRQLGADYVVTGNVESGADSMRVAFKLDDVRAGARIWSQALVPVFENAKAGASEEELAGRAAALIVAAIGDADSARAGSKNERERTSYDCYVLAGLSGPETTARSLSCLETATQREPANFNLWAQLSGVYMNQRVWGWGLSSDASGFEKRALLADEQLQAALRAIALAPRDSWIQTMLADGFYAKCQRDRFRVEAAKAVALNPYDAYNLGQLGNHLAYAGMWDEGAALAERAIKLMGPEAQGWWWLAPAKRHWLRGEYREAYEGFQRSYDDSSWLSHLDLAYTLPFLGRADEAKAEIKAILKTRPSFTLREVDDFYKLLCFEPDYREKMAGVLRQAGLPE